MAQESLAAHTAKRAALLARLRAAPATPTGGQLGPGNTSDPSAEEQLSRLREKIGDVEGMAAIVADCETYGYVSREAAIKTATAIRNHLLGEGK
jgi:hypothetical protein